MPSAADLADIVTAGVVQLVRPGPDREVRRTVLCGGPEESTPDPGDLVLAVGLRCAQELGDWLGRDATPAGVVIPASWSHRARSHPIWQVESGSAPDPDAPTVLGLVGSATWTEAATALQQSLEFRHGSSGSGTLISRDLFGLADRLAAILGGPVTIEDSGSSVVAYSLGQDGTDEARTSTIVGRQVPRQLRSHFRSRGVFRRIAVADEPFFVAPGPGGIRGRYVLPVHAGGEWLGSVWAVLDAPPVEVSSRDVVATLELIALHLLRMRAQGELDQQLRLDALRSALSGRRTAAPRRRETSVLTSGRLPGGPWRVAVVEGPPGLDVESQRDVWTALARRCGWRDPLIVDLDRHLYALVNADGTAAGSWEWLCKTAETGRCRDQQMRVVAGSSSTTQDGLPSSLQTALEVARLATGQAAATPETHWSELTLARALGADLLRGRSTPLTRALERLTPSSARTAATTLAAVIDHWGEPRRAAEALAVHPNTVRNRMARLATVTGADLGSARQRRAMRLELDAWCEHQERSGLSVS